MARIDFPDRGFGEHVDWSLLRPKMAAGMGALSEAVYTHSRLARARARGRPLDDRPRSTTASSARAPGPATARSVGVDEGFYGEVAGWRTSEALSERERLAAEFAQRFALDHQAMDDEFWARLRAAYADDEIADLTMCCGMFLGLGRALAVVGVPAPEDRILI